MLEGLLTLSTKVMKYLLFLSNFIFVLTGISLIVVGAIIKSSTDQYKPIFQDYSNYTTAPDLLIFLGCFIFIIAFMGCCGTLRESHCMIFTFSVLMVAIFIAEVAIGMTGYASKTDAVDVLKKGLNYTMYQYNKSQEDTDVWDVMQSTLDCCGTNGYQDWAKVLNNGTSLPMSCCASLNGDIGVLNCSATSPQLHRTPCLNSLTELIVSNASTIGTTGIVIAVIQLFAVIFSCTLAYSYKRSSYESV